MNIQDDGVEYLLSSASSSRSDEARNRPFVPRRVHTKSRGGCFYCKQRRVKCSEARPSCQLCSARGMTCSYPQQNLFKANQIDHNTSLQPQPVSTSFTLSDFRLFHHFILKAYPHHPIGNQTVWVQDVPALAHQYDFLMHAMLALAASDLTAISTADFTRSAISHRVLAVRRLKDVLSSRPNSARDTDALLATFYALGFQALYMDDGLIDFLTMVRGCSLVMGQIQSDGLNTIFSLPDVEAYVGSMGTDLDELPYINWELADSASASLRELKPLCTTDVESSVLHLLETTVIQMQSSLIQAYIHFMTFYEAIASLATQDFVYFIDPQNETMQLLLAHFVALHVLAAPFIMQEEFRFKCVSSGQKIHNWLGSISVNVSPSHQSFLEWPVAVVNASMLLRSREAYPGYNEKLPIFK